MCSTYAPCFTLNLYDLKRLDKIKNFIAVGLLALVLIPFVTLGKDNDITRFATVFALISWLVVVFYVNRKKRKEE